MTNLRGNLGYVIGSAIAGTGVFLSWFYESGLLGTVVGVIIGAVISFAAQTRTQKIAWKREYSVKVVEEVYGNLFGITKEFIAVKERKEYRNWSFGFWDSVQKDHRYFMVDKKFREELDNFSKRVTKFNDACDKLDNEVIPRILKSATKEKLPHEAEDTPHLTFNYTANKQNHSVALSTIIHLKNLDTLSDISENQLRSVDRSKVTNSGFSVDYTTIDLLFANQHPNSPLRLAPVSFGGNQPELVEYWELCRKLLKENETYGFVKNENEILLEQAREIMKELIHRIEEPWKI